MTSPTTSARPSTPSASSVPRARSSGQNSKEAMRSTSIRSRSSYFAAVGWALGLLSAASVTTIVILAAFSLRRLAFLIAALVPPRRDELLAEELLPPLAVVVPAHNERTTLQALFGSLERLEYPRDRLSVVLVDDGSTDTTAR